MKRWALINPISECLLTHVGSGLYAIVANVRFPPLVTKKAWRRIDHLVPETSVPQLTRTTRFAVVWAA